MMPLLLFARDGWFPGYSRNVVARSATIWRRSAARRTVGGFSLDVSARELALPLELLAKGLQSNHVAANSRGSPRLARVRVETLSWRALSGPPTLSDQLSPAVKFSRSASHLSTSAVD